MKAIWRLVFFTRRQVVSTTCSFVISTGRRCGESNWASLRNETAKPSPPRARRFGPMRHEVGPPRVGPLNPGRAVPALRPAALHSIFSLFRSLSLEIRRQLFGRHGLAEKEAL